MVILIHFDNGRQDNGKNILQFLISLSLDTVLSVLQDAHIFGYVYDGALVRD